MGVCSFTQCEKNMEHLFRAPPYLMIFAVNCGPVFINCHYICSELSCRISQYSTNFINTDLSFIEL